MLIIIIIIIILIHLYHDALNKEAKDLQYSSSFYDFKRQLMVSLSVLPYHNQIIILPPLKTEPQPLPP